MKGYEIFQTASVGSWELRVAKRLDSDGEVEITLAMPGRTPEDAYVYLTRDDAIALATRLLRSAQKEADA